MNLPNLYSRFSSLADFLRSPLLLVIRLYWGWQFMGAGWGKLTHLQRTTDYFVSLGIPAAKLNVLMAAGTETIGGALLLLGLFSRVATAPLIFTMGVAYVTADRDALNAILSDPDKFTGAAPFLFLFACLIVLAFGAGVFSLDRILFGKNQRE